MRSTTDLVAVEVNSARQKRYTGTIYLLFIAWWELPAVETQTLPQILGMGYWRRHS
jgi:hypothetical protein